MCEFCTKHGEGKKWYLEMKNYADELLHEELSATQQEIVETRTRVEWLDGLFGSFVMPAVPGISPARDELQDAPSSAEPPKVRPSEEEILRRRKVEHFGQVLPIEDVENVIDAASSITRLPCGCRFISTGKTDKRYCFGLAMDKWGILGNFPDAASSLELLDKETAKGILRQFNEEGLVHTVWTAVTPYVFAICNCDRDCMAYKGYIEKRGVPSFFRAEYICQTDWDLCTGCKSCMSQCQFGAKFYSSALEKIYIDPTRCFGCGACRAACPSDAITLIPRQKVPEVADLWLRTE